MGRADVLTTLADRRDARADLRDRRRVPCRDGDRDLPGRALGYFDCDLRRRDPDWPVRDRLVDAVSPYLTLIRLGAMEHDYKWGLLGRLLKRADLRRDRLETRAP